MIIAMFHREFVLDVYRTNDVINTNNKPSFGSVGSVCFQRYYTPD